MKVIKVTGRLIAEEKETILNYSYIDKKWYMHSFLQKHYNRALKQGWTVLVKYEYEDGSAAGYEFEAPERAITIRNTEKKKMTDKQLENLFSDCEDEECLE